MEAGTVIRFMSLRASREKGLHRLVGSPRLLSRPMDEISFILNQLGVECKIEPDGISIQSEGWKPPLMPVQVRRDHSSQFASSLLLNAWNLPFPLEFHMSGSQISESYWEMSLTLAAQLGMDIEKKPDRWIVAPNQVIKSDHLDIEADYSSMSVIAAAAALYGTAEFTNVGAQSLQPDFSFIEFFKKMGIPVEESPGLLKVKRADRILPQKLALTHCPDLFPMMAVLSIFSEGTTDLVETPQLIYKESNRLLKTQELLKKAGVRFFKLENGLQIEGQGRSFRPKSFDFDPDRDHRMAMAAGLLKMLEPQIQIQHPEVVNKSFPNFWSILGIS